MHWLRVLPLTQLICVVFYILHLVNSELYKNVVVNRCDMSGVISLEAAGSIIINFTKENFTSTTDCALRFAVAKGNRVSLTFVSNSSYLSKQLDVESTTNNGNDPPDCSNGYLKVYDPVANSYLVTEHPLCSVPAASQRNSYFTEDSYFALEIVTKESNPNGSLNFILNYTSFRNVTEEEVDGACYNCIQLGDVADKPFCIHPKLVCDGIINCPNDYASEEDFAFTYEHGNANGCTNTQFVGKTNTRRRKVKAQMTCYRKVGAGVDHIVCKFRCDFKTTTFVNSTKLCDGIIDCPNGKDEDASICRSNLPDAVFGNLSMADGVITIICAVILAILFSICMYCCCCPPPPDRVKLNSSNYNVNVHDGLTSTTLDGPGRTPQRANSRDHHDVRVSSL